MKFKTKRWVSPLKSVDSSEISICFERLRIFQLGVTSVSLLSLGLGVFGQEAYSQVLPKKGQSHHDVISFTDDQAEANKKWAQLWYWVYGIKDPKMREAILQAAQSKGLTYQDVGQELKLKRPIVIGNDRNKLNKKFKKDANGIPSIDEIASKIKPGHFISTNQLNDSENLAQLFKLAQDIYCVKYKEKDKAYCHDNTNEVEKDKIYRDRTTQHLENKLNLTASTKPKIIRDEKEFLISANHYLLMNDVAICQECNKDPNEKKLKTLAEQLNEIKVKAEAQLEVNKGAIQQNPEADDIKKKAIYLKDKTLRTMERFESFLPPISKQAESTSKAINSVCEYLSKLKSFTSNLDKFVPERAGRPEISIFEVLQNAGVVKASEKQDFEKYKKTVLKVKEFENNRVLNLQRTAAICQEWMMEEDDGKGVSPKLKFKLEKRAELEDEEKRKKIRTELEGVWAELNSTFDAEKAFAASHGFLEHDSNIEKTKQAYASSPAAIEKCTDFMNKNFGNKLNNKTECKVFPLTNLINKIYTNLQDTTTKEIEKLANNLLGQPNLDAEDFSKKGKNFADRINIQIPLEQVKKDQKEFLNHIKVDFETERAKAKTLAQNKSNAKILDEAINKVQANDLAGLNKLHDQQLQLYASGVPQTGAVADKKIELKANIKNERDRLLQSHKATSDDQDSEQKMKASWTSVLSLYDRLAAKLKSDPILSKDKAVNKDFETERLAKFEDMVNFNLALKALGKQAPEKDILIKKIQGHVNLLIAGEDNYFNKNNKKIAINPLVPELNSEFKNRGIENPQIQIPVPVPVQAGLPKESLLAKLKNQTKNIINFNKNKNNFNPTTADPVDEVKKQEIANSREQVPVQAVIQASTRIPPQLPPKSRTTQRPVNNDATRLSEAVPIRNSVPVVASDQAGESQRASKTASILVTPDAKQEQDDSDAGSTSGLTRPSTVVIHEDQEQGQVQVQTPSKTLSRVNSQIGTSQIPSPRDSQNILTIPEQENQTVRISSVPESRNSSVRSSVSSVMSRDLTPSASNESLDFLLPPPIYYLQLPVQLNSQQPSETNDVSSPRSNVPTAPAPPSPADLKIRIPLSKSVGQEDVDSASPGVSTEEIKKVRPSNSTLDDDTRSQILKRGKRIGTESPDDDENEIEEEY